MSQPTPLIGQIARLPKNPHVQRQVRPPFGHDRRWAWSKGQARYSACPDNIRHRLFCCQSLCEEGLQGIGRGGSFYVVWWGIRFGDARYTGSRAAFDHGCPPCGVQTKAYERAPPQVVAAVSSTPISSARCYLQEWLRLHEPTRRLRTKAIAGFIGVTVGSLQVTCSKLGISLRRPRFNSQNDLPGQGLPCSATVISNPSQVTPVRFAFEQVDQFLQSAQEAVPGAEAAVPHPDEIGKQKAPTASLALAMQYKGLERAIALCLTDDAVGKLVLEAQLQEMSVGQLVSALIRAGDGEGPLSGAR